MTSTNTLNLDLMFVIFLQCRNGEITNVVGPLPTFKYKKPHQQQPPSNPIERLELAVTNLMATKEKR